MLLPPMMMLVIVLMVFPGFNLAILFPNHKAQNTCLKGGRVK